LTFLCFNIFIGMRFILYILTTILLFSCASYKKVENYADEKPASTNGIIAYEESYEEAYDIIVEPDYIITYDEAPMLEAVPYEEEALLINRSVAYNEKLSVVEVSNNRVSNSTTNEGRIAYKIPTEMLVRNTYQVIVRVSKSSVHIYENLNGEVKTSSIPITQSMEVKVLDPSVSDNKMFDIVSDNKPIQLVENNENVTQWTFNVTPLRSGSSKLKVVVSIIRDGLVKEVVYEDDVTVKTDITKTVPYFIAKYWQWLLSTIIIPIIVWFTKRKKKSEDS